MRSRVAVLFVVVAAACGGTTRTRAPTASTPRRADALSVQQRDGVATVRADSKLTWTSVVEALDRLKQNGTIRFVLATTDGAHGSTKEITFPSTAELAPHTLSITHVTIGREGAPSEVDGSPVAGIDAIETALRGTARGSVVVISADRDTPFGAVVSVVNVVQGFGGRVLFGVVAPSTPESSGMRKPHVEQSSFAACPFPPEADAAAVDHASVTLEVKVDLSGRARAVRALDDPGYGFARAAQACALGATYEPARDANGAPVDGGTVKLSIRFERPSPTHDP